MEFVNTIGEAVLSSMEWVWARPWIYCVVMLVLAFVFLWDLVSGLSKKIFFFFCSPRFVSLRNMALMSNIVYNLKSTNNDLLKVSLAQYNQALDDRREDWVNVVQLPTGIKK